jgi:hypothetical protein
MSTSPQPQKELTGFVYGFLGVLVFSLTLPATRIAVSGFDPVFVGLGQAIIAAGLSLILLVVTRQTIPPIRLSHGVSPKGCPRQLKRIDKCKTMSRERNIGLGFIQWYSSNRLIFNVTFLP